MERLMKPAEYARELGISRQAVYAKIKKGVLPSKNVEGKLYIVLDSDIKKNPVKTVLNELHSAQKEYTEQSNYEGLLQAKDETIAVLKETVKDLKESNKEITTTLKGEIDLLKEAFHEMRNLYALQIEARNGEENALIECYDIDDESQEGTSEVSQTQERNWKKIKTLQKRLGIKKGEEKFKKRIKKLYKKGDSRVMKNKEGYWIDIDADYRDLV